MKILLVEDDGAFAASLMMILDDGFGEGTTMLAPNLADAHAGLESCRPAVIIVDGDFPDASPVKVVSSEFLGPRFIREARDAGFGGLVIGIPGGPDKEEAMRAVGCNHIFPKPFRAAEIVKLIQVSVTESDG